MVEVLAIGQDQRRLGGRGQNGLGQAPGALGVDGQGRVFGVKGAEFFFAGRNRR